MSIVSLSDEGDCWPSPTCYARINSPKCRLPRAVGVSGKRPTCPLMRATGVTSVKHPFWDALLSVCIGGGHESAGDRVGSIRTMPRICSYPSDSCNRPRSIASHTNPVGTLEPMKAIFRFNRTVVVWCQVLRWEAGQWFRRPCFRRRATPSCAPKWGRGPSPLPCPCGQGLRSG